MGLINKNVPVVDTDGNFVCYADDLYPKDYLEFIDLYGNKYKLLKITYQQVPMDEACMTFWTVDTVKDSE